MKASLNGVPHFSIGDGWWAEGYTGDNGWVIEAQAPANDPEAQDHADATAIYDLLERELVPTFYNRDGGVPRAWLTFVRHAIATVGPRFSARRMVKEYATNLYAPAMQERVGR